MGCSHVRTHAATPALTRHVALRAGPALVRAAFLGFGSWCAPQNGPAPVKEEAADDSGDDGDLAEGEMACDDYDSDLGF